jgi:signal peptidase I
LNEQDFPLPLAAEPTLSTDLAIAPPASLSGPAIEGHSLAAAHVEPPPSEAMALAPALEPDVLPALADHSLDQDRSLAEPAIETYSFAAAHAEPPSPEAMVPAPALEPVVLPVVLPADSIDQVSAWKRMGREVVAGVQTLLSAAVYATLIVTFGFQVARVDGLSMAPTLEDHDRLIVNKLVYEIGEPLPGDIVMLYYPLNPEKMFVKRVIAKEGDTVRIVDGRVYVNDVPLHDDYVPVEFRSHDDWGPQVIQQGYYFVMGDHRNNSSDSRHWGPVPKKYIVGKVKVRWWPLQDAKIF